MNLLLMSGGIDSTVLLYDLKNRNFRFDALYIDYGSQTHEMELLCSRKICEREGVILHHKRIDLRSFLTSYMLENSDDKEDNFIPFRNGILFSLAAGFAESYGYERVYSATWPAYPVYSLDCSQEFNKAMKEAILIGTQRIKVHLITPFDKIRNKGNIISQGQIFNVPFEDTYCCYYGEERHCWKCKGCIDRTTGFKEAKIKDPLDVQMR